MQAHCRTRLAAALLAALACCSTAAHARLLLQEGEGSNKTRSTGWDYEGANCPSELGGGEGRSERAGERRQRVA